MSEIATPVESKNPEGVKYSPLAFAVVSLIIVFVLYQIVGGSLAVLLAGGNITINNVTLARTLTMAAQFLFLLLPTLWLARTQHGKVRNALKWKIPKVNEIVLSILGMAALLQVAEGYVYFQDKIPLPESIAPFVEMVKKYIEETYKVLVEAHSLPELFFVIAVAAFTPAICEEVLFRGLVQKNLTLASNSVKGYIITGIIFGLYHFNPFLAVPLVALGIYFSFLQYRSQTLFIPIVAHFVNNTVSVIAAYVYGFDQSDVPSLLAQGTGEVSSMTILSSTIIFAVIFFIIVRMYIKVTEPAGQNAPQEYGGIV